MDRAELKSRVRALLARTFQVDAHSLPDPANADKVELWDSLGQLQLIEDLEAAFNVSILHDEAANLLSDDAIVDLLTKKL
ncbi:MAG: acyl carrier protein [Alphaproteobacteria bacterium]|nr:acyl carrier protein [Alphaproteobacteria bacterium]